jgi:hypothetical protein
MKDDGKRYNVVEFGRRLIETGDLDPWYIALHEAKFKEEHLCRILVAYFCFYHVGLSAWLSDQTDFWGAMQDVADGGKEWPRGTERRHFRGKMAQESVRRLRQRFVIAADMIKWLAGKGPEAQDVMYWAKSLHGFGEWIKWKIPDMIERLDIKHIQFRERDVVDMFPPVKKGALEACESVGIRSGLVSAHRYMMDYLGHMLAPPLYNRPLNVQETETIFCKWKSQNSGHYPIGKDTEEISEGLHNYADKSPTALLLLNSLMEGLKRCPRAES